MKKVFTIYILLTLTLGTYRGYLALLRDGKPIQQYPLQTRILPAQDQRKLESGIPIQNSRQLENLLQDYLS